MRRSVGSSVWSVLALVLAGVAMQAVDPAPAVEAAPPGALVAGVETPTNIDQLVGFTNHMASDTSGSLYIATGAQIWKVNGTSGALTLIAGTGELGYSGDGGPATAAKLTFPSALAVGSNGSVYFFDSYHIRRVTAGGTISSIAGTGVSGVGYDNAPATGQPIVGVSAIAVDSNQNVFFTQWESNFVGVRKISATTGDLLNAVAGYPATSTCSGLTGPPGSVVLGNGTLQLAIDRTFDEIYVAGSCSIGGFVVRITAGSSSLIAGGGASAPSAGLNALSARLPSYISDMGLLPAGELHLAAVGQLWRIDTGQLWPVAGTSGTCLFADGVGAANVCPYVFEFGSAGKIYVNFTGRLGRLSPSVLDELTPILSPPDGVSATSVALPNLYDLAVRGDGEVYYTAGTTGYLRTVTTAGILATKAGNGDPTATPTFGGAAVGSAIGYQQSALDTDAAGNVYLAVNNVYVAKITTAGDFVQLAGTGVYDNGPDGPNAANTAIAPTAVAAADDGTVYVLGTSVVMCSGSPCGTGQVLRRITTAGAISTLWTGPTGSYPYLDLAVAPDGSVVLMSRVGDLARWTPATGTITTIPFSDSGWRSGLRVDELGTIYIATNVAVRTVGPSGGAVGTAYAYASPGEFMNIDLDAAGALYVLHDGMIRKVAQTPGAPTNLAVELSGTSATITWTAPVRTGGTTLTGYRVERSTDGGSTWQTVTTVGAAPAMVSGLATGTAYLFRVVALNPIGAGPPSAGVAPVELPSGSDLALLPSGLEVSDSTPTPAQALTVSADGFTPYEWVAVVLQSTPTLIGSVQADATGAVHASLALPPGTTAGAHTLALVGDSSGNGYRAALTVVATDDGFAQPTPPPATFTALTPVRLFETRPGEPAGVVPVAKGRVGGANVLTVKVTGVAGVPSSGVGAVSLNVTAVDPLADGFVTVFPCGTRPLAANVNFVRGEIVPNAVIAPVSASGEVCFYAMADTFLVADINGWFAADAGFTALTPARLFETRPGEPAGVVPVAKGRVGGANVLTVKVTGVAGVPSSGVGAVSLNVTAVDPLADGFVTVYPCGDRPLAANVNFVAGEIVPNAVIAPVSASGEVCFYAYADTFLVADINGWFASGAGFTAVSPARLFETRPTEPQGAVAVTQQRYGGANVLTVKVTGVAGVPSSGVGAVSLNVTAVDPLADGFVTVFPCGDRPLAANVNFVAGEIVPNAVIAPVSASGEVCFYAMADTFLVADINGWFAATG